MSSLSSEGALTSENLAEIERRLQERMRYRRALKLDRHAAVLVPLCSVNGVASVLFTERSHKVGSHKGEVSFPGGMRDSSDNNVVATALRETEEEIGLPSANIRVLGISNDIANHTGKIAVTPCVGYIGEVDVSKLQFSEAEIASIFTVSLSHLCNPANMEMRRFETRSYLIPYFYHNGPVIWGLTGYLLYSFIREILQHPLKTS
jgi:nudix motif 8